MTHNKIDDEDPYATVAREFALERGIDPNILPSLQRHDEEPKEPLLEGVPGFINSMGAGIVDAALETKDFLVGGARAGSGGLTKPSPRNLSGTAPSTA
jgi:hypothetical protein